MARYFAKRLVGALVVLLGVSTIVFFVTHLSGDPAALMLPADATVEEVEALRSAMGLDEPLLMQYGRYMAGLAVGDFGTSLRHRQPAWGLVVDRLPATVKLATSGMALAILVGIPLGVIAALYRQSIIDLLANLVSLVGQSMANFWLGIMLIYIFSVRLGIFPSFGYGTWQHLVLPSIAVGTRLVAVLSRVTRSAVLDVVSEDYVRTAKSKGLSSFSVMGRHVLRNALIPVVTIIALQFGTLLGGTVILETVFSWPGVGLLTVQAIYNRDFPVVQASVFLLALTFVVINLLADLAYAYLDPRIRLQ